MAKFIIHTVPGSPFARAAIATLVEKNADWVLAAMQPGTHKQEPHLSRHPFGRIPVLEHDGFFVYETQAIVRYIDRALPHPSLTPSSPKDAARMDQMMNVNDWYLFQGVGSVIGFQRVVGPMFMGLKPDEAVIEAAMPKAHTVFAELSRALGNQDYYAGGNVSLADLMIAPQVDFLTVTPEWSKLSAGKNNLVAWLDRMRARPSMRETTQDKLMAIGKAGA
jgi:glutathione S-transferase